MKLNFLLLFICFLGQGILNAQATLIVSNPPTFNGPFTLTLTITGAPNSGSRYTVSFGTLINCTIAPAEGTNIIENSNSYSLDFTVTPVPANAATVSASITAQGNAAAGNQTLAGAFSSSLLPIELTYFSIEKSGERVMLNWSTATETNNESFFIEHSQDGRQFQTIGKVAGAGTSIETQRYSFEHKSPARGLNYYRLKQVDFDGAFDYSEVKSVTMSKGKNLNLKPNTVQSSTEINFSEALTESALLEVYNLAGQKMLEMYLEPGSQNHQLDVSHFPKGQYLIRLTEGKDVSVEKFQKL